MNKLGLLALSLSLLGVNGYAVDKNGATQNKNVTVVRAETSADGKSEISEKLLEECIVSLPRVEDLDAEVSSQSGYLKEINGDPAKNDFVKSYFAVIEINYMIHEQSLIIVTTASIQGQEPVMKVVEKNLKQSKRFESNPTEGEFFAGRSRRQYYFPTAEAAIKDVKQRAAIWLKQQSAVVCKATTGAKSNKN
jgi:hypothetical protein